MLLTALFLPRLQVKGPISALIAVIALAYINSAFWDAALFFKLPDSFTLKTGLLLLTNGIIFWILAKILPGIQIQGFLPALLAPIVFTIVSLFLNQYGGAVDWKKHGGYAAHQVKDQSRQVKGYIYSKQK